MKAFTYAFLCALLLASTDVIAKTTPDISPPPEQLRKLNITGECFPLKEVLQDIKDRHMKVDTLLLAADGDKFVYIREKSTGSVMLLAESLNLGCVVIFGPIPKE